MQIGLRVDVDTFRGTRAGVPRLCALLSEQSVTASFFFSVGPDNMGRHLWRLLRPDFLWKMLRTRATSLYGWDILLRGTFWPGPLIGARLGPIIKRAADQGHEVGFHAWDHHRWQARIDRLPGSAIRKMIQQGVDTLERITGKKPLCSAAPGWRCTDQVILEKSKFNFEYNSDCRGKTVFYPVVGSVQMTTPQVPVTLPTYDEVIGRSDVSPANYNDYLLSLLNPDRLNVLTVHAEVEGMLHRNMFADFIGKAKSRGWELVPLKTLVREQEGIPAGEISQGTVPGRAGTVAVQQPIQDDRTP